MPTCIQLHPNIPVHTVSKPTHIPVTSRLTLTILTIALQIVCTMALSVISAIFSLIGYGQTIYSLYEAANARGTLTLQDALRLSNSANARLFAGNEFARVQTARDRFYDVDLPSITRQQSIAQADITGSGFLVNTYHRIRSEAEEVWVSLQRLDWIFNNNVLHLDDYNFFARVIAQGHLLLLHMHSVILNLRSVELLGRVDVSDPKLLPETLQLASYLRIGLRQVTGMDGRVRGPRLAEISHVNTKNIPVGEHGNPTYRLYSWQDNYSRLSSTAKDQELAGDSVVSRYSDQSSMWRDPYQEVVNKREQRVRYITDIYNNVTGNFLGELADQQRRTLPSVEQRIVRQRARPTSAEAIMASSADAGAMAEDLIDRYEVGAGESEVVPLPPVAVQSMGRE